MNRYPYAHYRLGKALWLQTLRAALIGVAIGASFGLLTSLGSWVAHQTDRPPNLPGLTYIIGALDIGAFPGMTIGIAIQKPDMAPEHGFSPGEVTSPAPFLAICNILFWAAVWALLLAWPGPLFALWLKLARSSE